MPFAADYFLSTRPAYPWSASPLGPPALALVAAALVGLTLATYLRNPIATRGKILLILGLRIAALIVALITAVRPSLGILDDPKVPSTLVIGVDLSESMTIKDEFNAQTRLAAVRTVLQKSQPVLDQLQSEQNVTVAIYGFGPTEFTEATGKYDPEKPADAKRSDYAAYLTRTLEKWQAERFIRGHLLIGDGADNGTGGNAIQAATKWRSLAPLHTFAVGKPDTAPDAKDVAVAAVAADPSPVPVKNDLTIKVIVNAFGFAGAKVPVVVSFDGKQVAKEEFTLPKQAGNEVLIKLKAPDKPGEVKVRVEIPIESVPGDVAPANNVVETYLTVTKEGVRVLLIDRLRPETAHLRRALVGEKRFDVAQVVRQADDPAGASERELLDFDARGYDAIILGNISAAQLRAADPKLAEKIAEQVRKKGTGLLFLAGDAAFAGTPDKPLENGIAGTPLQDLLPVSLTPPNLPADLFRGEGNRFQTLPTAEGLRFLFKVAGTEDASKQLWDKLNAAEPFCRMTALSAFGTPKPGAVIYATASTARAPAPLGLRADQLTAPWLLAGWQTGDGDRGRVLAFAGYDSANWKAFGLRNTPPTRDGIEMHAQFWRRLVLWLAHQDEDDGAAFARPEFRRLPVLGKQSIRVGLRQTGGGDAKDPRFTVKIQAPGQPADQAQPRPVIADPAGGSKVVFDPPAAGEYTVLLTATGTDAAGKEVKGDAQARFLVYPETTDEMLRAAAEPEYLEKLSRAGGGTAYRLEDLPGFLKELAATPATLTKPKPKFVPDWRRAESKGFLPLWLTVFATLVLTEWGLRRWWGLA